MGRLSRCQTASGSVKYSGIIWFVKSGSKLLRIVCVKSHGAECSWSIWTCPLCVQECLVWSHVFLTLASSCFYILARFNFFPLSVEYHILSLLGDSSWPGIPAVTKSSSLEHLQQDLDLWSWDLDSKDIGLLCVFEVVALKALWIFWLQHVWYILVYNYTIFRMYLILCSDVLFFGLWDDLAMKLIFDHVKVKVHLADCLNWMKKRKEEERGGQRVKGSYDFMMCQQNARGETAAGHTFYAQRISIFRMHRGWGPRLRLQSPSAHSHSLDFRARLSAAQKRIHKEFQDVSLNIFGFKADLNEHSTMSVHVFDHCSVLVSQWPPSVCTICVKD